MVCDSVLRIKNLPKELSDAEKEEFLRHFGAIQVKIFTSNSKQTSTAYAKFQSKEIAKSVMLRLHQITILNSRLCLEFAEHDVTEGQLPQKPIEVKENNNKNNFKAFLNKLNAWNNSVSFNQPPPPHLKYSYPKPNRATINNIAHALASVPKFYTQVLHLMNRMNLPPPFSDIPDPPQIRHRMPVITSAPARNLLQQEPPKQPEQSSESELESDSESSVRKEIIPQKRVLSQKKIVKRPKFIKPSIAQPNTGVKNVDRTEEAFERVDIQTQKRIEVKVSADSLDQKRALGDEHLNSENAEETSALKPQEEESPTETHSGVITEEELASNRIPEKDLSVVQVFKNYQPGTPTSRLYIKNIAKTVEMKDLEFIYKRYIKNIEDENESSQFNIRLMQEGKMKGQAFITLDSVQLAQKALKDTNGYILKDKPLVVVFARSAVPKK